MSQKNVFPIRKDGCRTVQQASSRLPAGFQQASSRLLAFCAVYVISETFSVSAFHFFSSSY
jgi:hypothetical protein